MSDKYYTSFTDYFKDTNPKPNFSFKIEDSIIYNSQELETAQMSFSR